MRNIPRGPGLDTSITERETSLVNKRSHIKFPLQYNHILQGFIYQHLTTELINSLHQEGYQYRKRSFKIVVSSPVERFIHEMAEALLKT